MTPALKRLMFWAPLALALAVVLAWLFRPAAVPVDLVAVDRGPLAVSVSDEGETRVRDMYAVSAPVPGRMRRIELEVGDPVEANETLVARIEPSDPSFLDMRSAAEARANVDAAAAARTHAEAQVRRVQAELDFARAEYERIRALARSHTVSENELDSAQRPARTAEAALAEAQAERKVRDSEYQVARSAASASVSYTSPSQSLSTPAVAHSSSAPGYAAAPPCDASSLQSPDRVEWPAGAAVSQKSAVASVPYPSPSLSTKYGSGAVSAPFDGHWSPAADTYPSGCVHASTEIDASPAPSRAIGPLSSIFSVTMARRWPS